MTTRGDGGVPLARMVAAFAILFALYQSAEGVGALLLHQPWVQNGLMLLTLAAAWPVGRFVLNGRGYGAYQLGWRDDVPRWLIGGMALAMGAKAAAIAIGLTVGVYRPSPDPLDPLTASGIGFALLATFVPSLTEDILTRGLWWRVPAIAATPLRFVLLTALIYLGNHVFRLANGPAEWAMLLCYGIAYATAMVRGEILWAAVGLHWGWNLANALAGAFASYDADPVGGPILSGAVHLAMAAIMLALPRRAPLPAAA